MNVSVLPNGQLATRYSASQVTIAIPTLGREDVLLSTIRSCLAQAEPAGEILVIDQTSKHEPGTTRALQDWHNSGRVRWVRRSVPSVTAAMNEALLLASNPLVLFLDDDIVPIEGFVAAHAAAHDDANVWVVAGQVIQPWQEPVDLPRPPPSDGLRVDLDFPFHSMRSAQLLNVMAGNMSVIRDRALGVGGFDENFQGTAYRFETEFARRVHRAGGTIMFEPSASIRHLRVTRGGTRVHGNHLTSASPTHGVGDYYFALLHGFRADVLIYIVRRLRRELCTKFHLRHPWYIPVKFLGEVRALCWAWKLRRAGPTLIQQFAK